MQIVLAMYLIMGLAGLTPSALADMFHPQDCCTDCSEPDCPDEESEGCPPLCSDCMCPSYASAMIEAETISETLLCTIDTEQTWFAGVGHEPPVAAGIFRPPRQLV